MIYTNLHALENLEKSGKHLFHDSSNGNIEVLKPRQARSWGKPDGAPAVYASSELLAAMFMAIIGSRKGGGWGKLQDGKTVCYTTETIWRRAHDQRWEGSVYVLKREGFLHRKGFEWFKNSACKPFAVYKVGIDSLADRVHVVAEEDWDKFRREVKSNE